MILLRHLNQIQTRIVLKVRKMGGLSHLLVVSDIEFKDIHEVGCCDLMSLLSNQEKLFGRMLLCLEITHEFEHLRQGFLI